MIFCMNIVYFLLILTRHTKNQTIILLWELSMNLKEHITTIFDLVSICQEFFDIPGINIKKGNVDLSTYVNSLGIVDTRYSRTSINA